jgi:hypothetical protein
MGLICMNSGMFKIAKLAFQRLTSVKSGHFCLLINFYDRWYNRISYEETRFSFSLIFNYSDS